MKTRTITTALATAFFAQVAVNHAAADTPSLQHKLNVTPEVKKAFHGSDAIEIRQIAGTAPKFQVGGTYRVTGVCRQQSLKNATLYIGNSAEAGADAIIAATGSSLFKPLSGNQTEFDVTFTVLRPGILHMTIYDIDNHDKNDNVYAGIYLGDVVFKH